MKILLMTTYCDRPYALASAIKSVVAANDRHADWCWGLHDDGSSTPAAELVRTHVPEDLQGKMMSYRTVAVKAQRLHKAGMIGHVFNQMIQDAGADIAFILGVEERLHPEYLANLNRFFEAVTWAAACYSHIVAFDSEVESWQDSKGTDHPLNKHTTPINPAYLLDPCQVAWRTAVHADQGVWLPYPSQSQYAARFFDKLHGKIGPVPFSGFVGQYTPIGTSAHKPQTKVNDRMADAMQKYLNGDFAGAKAIYEEVLKLNSAKITAKKMLEHCNLRLAYHITDNIP